MKLVGTWYIYEMEVWNEEYFNMEVQAFVNVLENGSGEFQFGLVRGYMDGEIVEEEKTTRIEFTWEGSDECDEAFGSGWLKLKEANTLEGCIEFHHSDSSLFLAKRAE